MTHELLATWTRSEHSHEGVTHDTWRKGSGPGVVVIHEIPGMTPAVIAFAEEVVEAGFTVVMPHLFGTPGSELNPVTLGKAFGQVCVSREFTKLARNETTPIAVWLRSLARELHEELGGPGVGAIGMCFTGGFALAMTVDAPVVAPVLSQPSAPFAVTPGRRGDLGLSPADREAVAAGTCPVLGLRYKHDPAVGSRFSSLQELLGDRFIRVEFPGVKHSVLTLHRQQAGVDAVLDFLAAQLN